MKQIFITIIMVVCAHGMFAQTDLAENDSVTVPTPTTSSVNNADASNAEMAKLWKQFQQYSIDAAKEDFQIKNKVPITGKSKFARHFFVKQQIEMSLIGNSDGDSDKGKSGSPSSDDINYAKGEDGNTGFGLNSGYTIGFIWGRPEENMLRINPLGLGLILGFVTSFDRQDYYGTTFDILGKIGIEAGYGHKMGVTVSFLAGTGKSAGEYIFLPGDNGEELNIPYTAWCRKFGVEFSVRSNLLHVQMKDAHVQLFARYIHSKNPEDENELMKQGILCNWLEESLTFGLTICHEF